jgi:hypothetical protein
MRLTRCQSAGMCYYLGQGVPQVRPQLRPPSLRRSVLATVCDSWLPYAAQDFEMAKHWFQLAGHG